MYAFTNGYRWAVAVAAAIGFGALMATVPAITPAHADSVYQFRGEASPSRERGQRASQRSRQRVSYQGTQARRMRLGAIDPQKRRESLTGGSRRISQGRSTRKSRGARRNGHRPGVRTASLGNSFAPSLGTERSLTGGRVKWVANSGCLNARLRAVINQVASSFGPVTVNSTCRGRRHNARVGGARHSHHLSGNAVDFRVHGAGARAVYSFLRSHGAVGGLKLYRRGFFHIDTGSRRTW